MKAKPVKIVDGSYVQCSVEEATHVTLHFPGPQGVTTLPVIRNGTRQGTPNWTWNGSVDSPTLRPSILTTSHYYRCHSWVNDGQVQFLSDCSHPLANTTVPLLEVDEPQPEEWREWVSRNLGDEE